MYSRKEARVPDEEMRSYFKTGELTDLEIAEKTGYKRNTVAQIRLQMGYPPGGRKFITTPLKRVKAEDRQYMETFGQRWVAVTGRLKARYGDMLKTIELKRECDEEE